MKAKWFGFFALVLVAISLVSVSSCGDPQELVAIQVQPTVETFGSSTTPVIADAGLQVQLRALGTYVHPPATKDITSSVTWASNDTQMFTVSSGGLLTATGQVCGGTLVSATVTTNSTGSGVSASGNIVTGYMTANVVCSTAGGGGSEPTLTINFAGLGIGTVVVSPSNFSCASPDVSCVTSFPTGTTLTLTATPLIPSSFGGWSGACTGTTCTILLESDTTVTATFN